MVPFEPRSAGQRPPFVQGRGQLDSSTWQELEICASVSSRPGGEGTVTSDSPIGALMTHSGLTRHLTTPTAPVGSASLLTSLSFPSEKLGTHSTSCDMVAFAPGSALLTPNCPFMCRPAAH